MGMFPMRTLSCRGWVPTMVALVAIGLAACGSTQNEPSSESSISTSTSPNDDDDVPAALDFTAELVGGGTFSGPSIAGQPVVLWFWGPT